MNPLANLTEVADTINEYVSGAHGEMGRAKIVEKVASHLSSVVYERLSETGVHISLDKQGAIRYLIASAMLTQCERDRERQGPQ